MTKKYKDVMIKHIRMNGLCCEVFEKGMALSHLPIMMKITKQDHHGKKGNLLFGRLGVVGIRPFLRVVILADPTNPSPFLSHDLFTFS